MSSWACSMAKTAYLRGDTLKADSGHKKKGIRNESPQDVWARLRSPVFRLLLIPLLVYSVWVIEIFLFQGRLPLFLHPEPPGLLFYTVMTCICVGLVVPIWLIKQAFLSGDVNMHQLGFRSLRRTVLMTVLTLLIIWMSVVLQNPFGTDRAAFLVTFLLLLPTGIASALICCILAGTHLQALVRSRGVVVAISAGSIVSGLLFGMSIAAHIPGGVTVDLLVQSIAAGVLAAVFFFAVRDIWAVSVVMTGSLVYLMAGWIDPRQFTHQVPAIALAAAITVATLIVIQWYLSRRYVTIPAPRG